MRAWRDGQIPPTSASGFEQKGDVEVDKTRQSRSLRCAQGDPRFRLWVGGLPSDISEVELFEEFSKHGTVESVAIRSSLRDTFAFVQCANRTAAEAAICALDRRPIWGSAGIRVKIAHDLPGDAPPDSSAASSTSTRHTEMPPLERPWANGNPPCHAFGSASAGSVAQRTDARQPDSSTKLRTRSPDSPDPFCLFAGVPPQNQRCGVWITDALGPIRPSSQTCAPQAPELSDRDRSLSPPRCRVVLTPAPTCPVEPSKPVPRWWEHDNRQGMPHQRPKWSDEGRWPKGIGKVRQNHSKRRRQDEASGASGVSNGGSAISDGSPHRRERTNTPRKGARHTEEWRVANLQLTLENIPSDMSWLELKNLGRMYGYVAYARTQAEKGRHFGILEFSHGGDRHRAAEALHGKHIEGAADPIKVHLGNSFHARTHR